MKYELTFNAFPSSDDRVEPRLYTKIVTRDEAAAYIEGVYLGGGVLVSIKKV